jgi:arsenate reductase-like glutaredoxin family protein
MKTAVEWLIDESMKLVVQYMKGTLNEDTLDDVIYELGTKAKEMEKENLESLKDFDTWKEWKNKSE